MQTSSASTVDWLLAAAAVRAKARARMARNEHRHGLTIHLAEIDRQILHMRVKARTAVGDAKDRLDDALNLIAQRRARFGSDLDALQRAPSSVWSTTKATLDLECVALRTFVHQVAASLFR